MIIACELQFSSWKTKTSKSKWNTQGIHYIHWQQQLQESAKSKEEENQAKKWNKNYRFDYFQGTTRHAYYSAAAVLGANCANSISEIEAINFKKGLETRMVFLLPFWLEAASQKLFHTTTQNTMMVFVLHQT